jgi:vacuolar-type H+-ATPase subunit E/Vma4
MSVELEISDKQMKALIKEHIDNMQSPEEMSALLKLVVKKAAEWESYTDCIDWAYVQKKAAKAVKDYNDELGVDLTTASYNTGGRAHIER